MTTKEYRFTPESYLLHPNVEQLMLPFLQKQATILFPKLPTEQQADFLLHSVTTIYTLNSPTEKTHHTIIGGTRPLRETSWESRMLNNLVNMQFQQMPNLLNIVSNREHAYFEGVINQTVEKLEAEKKQQLDPTRTILRRNFNLNIVTPEKPATVTAGEKQKLLQDFRQQLGDFWSEFRQGNPEVWEEISEQPQSSESYNPNVEAWKDAINNWESYSNLKRTEEKVTEWSTENRELEYQFAPALQELRNRLATMTKDNPIYQGITILLQQYMSLALAALDGRKDHPVDLERFINVYLPMLDKRLQLYKEDENASFAQEVRKKGEYLLAVTDGAAAYPHKLRRYLLPDEFPEKEQQQEVLS